MKRRFIIGLLCITLLLTGCGISGKRYVSVTPHQTQQKKARSEVVTATSYSDLIGILEDMIEEGAEDGAINISAYAPKHVERDMELAVYYAMNLYPLGAYSVDDIVFGVGTSGGLPAMAVTIRYRHTNAEIRQIRTIVEMAEAEPMVAAALRNYDATLAMEVERYQKTDFQQMAQDYAEAYPELVMEVPQVTTGVYGNGEKRVVELSFAYQNDRELLRQMQMRVRPVFEAAELYVSGDGAQWQKFSQLYAFLMERFDYQVETSDTPAYSLLTHGIGDSRAFATVYAAMCRRAGLECMVVTGSRSGEPWTWNLVQVDGNYQHVDLLRCDEKGEFRALPDRSMQDYEWDQTVYPECPAAPAPAQESSGHSQQVIVPETTAATESP